MSVHDLIAYPIHLGRGASASVEPPFTGSMAWYESYEARHAHDGIEGRLVSMHTFTESWTMWEMHPHGAKIVLCTHGSMVLHQEHPGGSRSSERLAPGQYAVNPAGTWHTADVDIETTAVFVTAGVGTQHRPR